MAKNLYQILGVTKNASDADIKSAYRKLAKQHHPDLNPGSKEAATTFANISKAYDILSDKEKRAAYDRNEIDAEGEPRYEQPFYRDYASGPQGARYSRTGTGGGFSTGDFEDLFGSFFKGSKAARPKEPPAADAHYETEIDFMDAALGGKKRIITPDGRTLDITIPAGIEDGQQLRLKGQAAQKTPKTPPGDAYVVVHVRPHSQFTRKGNDIHIELPINIVESVTGEKIRVPTIHGAVDMAVPKGADSDTTLRLRNKGIKGGDQYVKLKLLMPDIIDHELEQAIRHWAEHHTYNPRRTGAMA